MFPLEYVIFDPSYHRLLYHFKRSGGPGEDDTLKMDLATTPAMAPPPGEVTDFNPGMTSIQKRFITIYAGTLAAATFCLALRLWTRARIVRSLWLDDCKSFTIHLLKYKFLTLLDAVVGAWLMNIGFFISCLQCEFFPSVWIIMKLICTRDEIWVRRPFMERLFGSTSQVRRERYASGDSLLLGTNAYQVLHPYLVGTYSSPHLKLWH